MVHQTIRISNPTGLHLRPAGRLCEVALRYESAVTFRHGDTTANAKSLLSVLGACIKYGDEVEFICEGPDEEEALAAVTAAIRGGLGE